MLKRASHHGAIRATSLLLAALLMSACGGGDDADPTQAAPQASASTSASTFSCGAEITESVTLTADLVCDPIGLIVTGEGVEVDLAGHTISGPGAGRRAWPMPNFDNVGIMVQADNVVIRNGTVTQFGMSVLVNEQRGVTIENVRTAVSYYGIYVYRGGGNQITGNTVVDNVYGLHFQDSDGNRATGNDLSHQTHHSPGGYGLYLYSSNDNWFEGNAVRENLNWGLWFSDSTGNTIVRNNIIGNDPQVSDDSVGNVFYDDARREGNFWSDYAGPDDNGDGVGDVPYTVGGPGRSADIYPFAVESGWVERTSQTLAPATPPPSPDIAPRAYVALDDGQVAVVAVDTQELLDTWDAGAFGPLATSPDGLTLYALAGDGEAASVVALDVESGEERGRWEVPGAQALAASYDGERVLVSSSDEFTEIVLDTGELRRQEDGRDAVAITPSWKHNLVLVTREDGWLSVVYLPDQHSPYGTQLAASPVQAIDNRAGTRLFVVLNANREVHIVDTEQFVVTDRVPLGEVEPRAIRIAPSPDGTTLYVLDAGRSRIAAIDLGTKGVLAEVEIDGSAVDLAVSADGSFVTVVAGGSSARAVIFDRELRPLGSVDLPAMPLSVVAPR